ncbi:MAG: peptidase M14 [Chlorobi bacterium]|nr:peptidase M14 [Chlorobiota bacterium]
MFAKQLFNTYENFKELKLLNRRFKHKDILSLIVNRNPDIFKITEIGKSFEDREIFMLKTGTGKRKVLLWSQMHGNESTATQAFFDIFKFFENPGILHKEATEIINSCTLYFIPMLNPDGAELFQRRNAQDIDINRDALKLQTPEGNLLMQYRDIIHPEFGFNLHDQDIWYSAGKTKFPATISFLAPAYDTEKCMNENRKKSMQLIAEMTEVLQNFIPNQIGRYSDDFMETAFGDNIQKRGTSTILIESGGFPGDIEKQFVRKLSFTAILSALYSVSKNNFEKKSVSDYESVPLNKKNNLFDFILRDAVITRNGKTYTADIGIRSRSLADKDIYEVFDIGDLSQNFAYSEINLNREQINDISIGQNADYLIEKHFNNPNLI